MKKIKVDGVVKSPIYYVVVFFQALGILHVWPRSKKIIRLVYEPFYEIIKVDSIYLAAHYMMKT